MSEYAGRKVLITGAASGIGRLMALRVGAEGAHLILWDVNAQGLEKVRAELEAAGRKVSTYACNLTDRKAIAATAAQTLQECGPVDILINNAGVVSGKTLLAASEEDIVRTFDVNVLALFWATRAFLPGMIERNRGHIVTIASAAGIVGTSRLIDYCSSKHAAVGFDEALRLELKRQGSKVMTTVVCPFYISTGMFEGVKTRFPRLLPILEPDYVADRIVDAIRKNKRRLLLPRFVYTTWLARLMPVTLFDAIMDFFGINKSMDEFTGRAGH
jgi:all-trans-retinol dehydrogenase (NAD+)